MKKFECECGVVIGLNQVKRHKQGKSHLQRMELKNKKKEEKILLEDCYTCKGCDFLMVKGTHNLNYINDEVYCNNCNDKKIVEKIQKKVYDKWNEIVERRSHYLKQEEQDRERDLRIIQLSNISDKYLEWLID